MEFTLNIEDQNVAEVVVKHMERARLGLTKYGVTTERKDLDLLDWLNHAQEEAMDLAVYIQRVKHDVIRERQNLQVTQRELELQYGEDAANGRPSQEPVGVLSTPVDEESPGESSAGESAYIEDADYHIGELARHAFSLGRLGGSL